MKTCEWLVNGMEPCGKPCEGKNALCASHGRDARKLREQAQKQAEKLAKALLKRPDPRKTPNKVSEKRKVQNAEYLKVRAEYLKEHEICEARIFESCTRNAEEIHHQVGRSGDLLTDKKYFLAVCRGCHDYIHQHTLEALKRNLSFSRLSTNETI